VFLKFINPFFFIYSSFQLGILRHQPLRKQKKNKLILELSELRYEMLSTVDMEMAGFRNFVLCTQILRDLLPAPSGQKRDASSSLRAVYIH